MTPKPFDLSHEYDAMLAQGIRLSGEDKHFFIRGRIRDLKRQLPPHYSPKRVLDFGCGLGDTTSHLAATFPRAEILGLDTAEKALAYANETYGCSRISFALIQTFSKTEAFDLCYVNGVFHHISPQERPDAVRLIHKALVSGGSFALFENNPWSPAARLVMSRIPFDRDAQLMSSLEARRLLREGGFARCVLTRFLFYFPRPLAFLRFSEPWLARLPLGAQYYVLAVKT